MNATPEQVWSLFIAKLNEVEPLGKKNEKVEHKCFIGAIPKYEKVFIQAWQEAELEAWTKLSKFRS